MQILQAEGSRDKEVIIRPKSRLVRARLLFLQGMTEVCQADYLIYADQANSDWFKIPFLEEPKLKLSLSLMTWGLARVIPFWVCHLLPNNAYRRTQPTNSLHYYCHQKTRRISSTASSGNIVYGLRLERANQCYEQQWFQLRYSQILAT